MKKDTFSSTIDQKILDFLSRNPQEGFYSAQIAFETDLSKGGTNQSLHKMAREGLLKTEKKGRMVFYRADPKSPLVKQYKILKNISILQSVIDKLKALSERVILFGSCAQGEDTQESDMDIFVVSEKKERARDIVLSARLKRKVQLVIKTPQQYLGLDKKEPAFYREVRKGIVLWEKE